MLKKLYQKSEIWFAVVWIVAYCVLMSVGDGLSAMVGVEKSVTLAVAIALSVVLLLFLKNSNLMQRYGLCLPQKSAKQMLFYLPIVAMLTANLWHGLAINYSAVESVLYVLSMLCVGFLEEVIFRGLLFESLKKDNVKVAIIVSSVTFGIGHIINLFNGSGADLLPNVLQVVYATSAGFMFVMMYLRSKSLFVCIVAHGLFNALSAFSNNATTPMQNVVSALLLTAITGGYALYLAFAVKPTQTAKS